MATRPDIPESDEVERTAPPETDEATGIAMLNGYPVNLRLRAEALSKDGKAEDPDGLVAAELIEDAGDRLARERSSGPPAVSDALSREKLERIARAEGVDTSTASTKADVVRLIEERRATDPAVSPPSLEG